MTDSIHSCGYHCERPNCVKRQRDELVRKYVVEQEAPELSDDEERKAFEAAYLEHIDPDAVFDRYDFTKKRTDVENEYVALEIQETWEFARALLSRKQEAKHDAALQELVDIAQEHDMGYGDKK